MKFWIPVILFFGIASAQQSSDSKIEQVTVYLSNARVTRNASIQLNPGSNEIQINKLSPDIDESSIQISDLDGLKLLGLSYEVYAAEEKAKSNHFEKIQTRLDSITQALESIGAKHQGLEEEELILKSNRSLNSKDTGLSLAQVKSFGSYYNERTEQISLAKSKLTTTQNDLNQLFRVLKADQSKLDPVSNKAQGTINLKLVSTAKKKAKITLVYNVSNAGWVPTYDINAMGKTDDITLNFKGQIYQQTGADWSNVRLKLSTGDPNVDNTKPNLEEKRLRFINNYYTGNASRRSNKKYNPTVNTVRGKVIDPNGDPILGAVVMVPGTSNATTTDFDGNYVIDVESGKLLNYSFSGYESVTEPVYASTMNQKLNTSLEAVIVTSYRTSTKEKSNIAASTVTTNEIQSVEDNIASRNFELSENYTILSSDGTTDVNIFSNKIEATYEYYTAPVINENVFLTAILKNYENLNLIPGEANIYFEDAYTGKIYLDTDTTEENLTIGLGVDPQITVKREEIKNFESSSFLGSNRITEKRYEITIKNNRSNATQIKIQDRIPVSSNNDIKVDQVEIGNATLSDKENLLTWIIDLNSGQQEKRTFSYRVKFPKDKRINLK
ncbi:DUF4139 domain-containing protein [Nonlabens marinus]|uniref:TonB-dependent receptor n=1 Tax=Nonlabens marinus S1-08 TaxID=1454201 RepID=W8VMU8_9FLAO|nr:DUF4139 domain-containing protein [Nonlabens marinus]BAO54064.1 TonB-dependent receptor [Nonlabens marinus S1-08]